MSEGKQDRMPYFLLFCRHRLLLENIDGHLVDIGGVEVVNDAFRWRLDGNDASGETSMDVEDLFTAVESALTFLFVDGQFTSLPDVSEEYGDRLDNAPSRQIILSALSDADEEQVR